MIAQVPANILQIGAKCVEVHLGAAPQFSTLEGCRMPLSCRAWGREETESLAWVWSQLLSQSCPQILVTESKSGPSLLRARSARSSSRS